MRRLSGSLCPGQARCCAQDDGASSPPVRAICGASRGRTKRERCVLLFLSIDGRASSLQACGIWGRNQSAEPEEANPLSRRFPDGHPLPQRGLKRFPSDIEFHG